MNIEVPNDLREMGFESIQESNAAFIAGAESHGDGLLKNSSAGTSQFIRKRIRENGFQRSIIELPPVGDEKFDRELEHELPSIVEDMEPDSPGAKSIPFNDGPDTQTYRGNRYMIRFSKITTPEFTKNIDELRTYRMDLRQVVTDNALKDMETEEDGRFIKAVDRIIGPVGGVGSAGVAQNHEIAGRITRKNYKNLINYLQDLDLNNGVFLVNRHTATEFLGWDRNEEGGDMAQQTAQQGLRAFSKFERFGVPHIATIKRGLVPDMAVYLFAEQGYLGKGYQLQEPTMYVERKKDILRFSAQEKLGFTIANVRACARVLFTG